MSSGARDRLGAKQVLKRIPVCQQWLALDNAHRGARGRGPPRGDYTRPPTDSARQIPTGLEPQKQCGAMYPDTSSIFLVGAMLEKGKKEGLFISMGCHLCCFNWEINGLTAEPRTRTEPHSEFKALAFPLDHRAR